MLSEILKGTAAMPIPMELMVGIETADDAAVYRLNDQKALIATTTQLNTPGPDLGHSTACMR